MSVKGGETVPGSVVGEGGGAGTLGEGAAAVAARTLEGAGTAVDRERGRERTLTPEEALGLGTDRTVGRHVVTTVAEASRSVRGKAAGRGSVVTLGRNVSGKLGGELEE